MKIYLDNIIYSLQVAGGISNYWYEMTKRLQAVEKPSYIENHNHINIFRESLNINPADIITEKKYPFKINRYRPIKCLPHHPAIFHTSYYRYAKCKNIANIVTIYDFTYEYFSKGIKKTIHTVQKKHSIENASGIICISNNTKEDLLKYYPKINKDIIEVTHLAANANFRPLAENEKIFELKEALQSKFILFIGSRALYKNFDIAVEATRALSDHQLYIVGGGALSLKEKGFLDNNLFNRYRHFEKLSTPQLNILYNHAFCLLYPSSYEGFGIPILEAMQAGCPVIATNSSSIPEVIGSKEFMVDEIKPQQFVNKMELLLDQKVRQDWILFGFENSSKFSWEKCFEKLFTFYNKIYNKRFS